MIRAIGLRGALAVNLITMVGIGPLVTIPLIVTLLPGPSALFAWGLGALVALCDGLGWAELGALYPQAGGTYAYLREAYGAEGPGRLLAFSYAWLVLFATPPLLASGYLGFARYAAYFWPPLATDATLQGLLAALVGLVTLAILWRTIGTVDATNLVLAFATLATLAAIALAAAARFAASRAFGGGPPHLAATLGMALGPALVIALYDYTGYGAACTLGEEVRAPSRTLPRAVVGAILLVAVAYSLLQIGALGALDRALVPAHPGGAPPPLAIHFASTIVERAWGVGAARCATAGILVVAFASTLGNLLAFSRVPFAAARDGLFFAAFGGLAPRGRFPAFALAVLGLAAIPACFVPLATVIGAFATALAAQSVAQLGALFALRRRGIRSPYRMWLFPLPALIAIAGWCYAFASAGAPAIAYGLLAIASAILAYLWRAHRARDWPFAFAQPLTR